MHIQSLELTNQVGNCHALPAHIRKCDGYLDVNELLSFSATYDITPHNNNRKAEHLCITSHFISSSHALQTSVLIQHSFNSYIFPGYPCHQTARIFTCSLRYRSNKVLLF